MPRAVVVLVLLAFAAAAPATAAAASGLDRHGEMVAYGEGVTRCGVDLEKRSFPLTPFGLWEFRGFTSCTAALQQSGHAWLTTDEGVVWDAAVCSQVATQCSSGRGGRGYGPSGTLAYDVHLTAPRGQGWISAPSHCTGIGTDNLRCRFVTELTEPVEV